MSDPLPGFMPGKNCEKKQNKSRIVPSSMKRSSNDGCLQKKANVLIIYYPCREAFLARKSIRHKIGGFAVLTSAAACALISKNIQVASCLVVLLPT